MPRLEAFYTEGDDVISFRDGHILTPVEDFVYGVTRPVPGVNIGLVSPTTITVSAADTTYPSVTTITDTEFLGNINVTSNGLTYFYNCLFRGKITNTGNNIVRANNVAQGGVVFERCEFRNRWFPADNASNGAHGSIQCHDTTLIRCDMSNAADSLGIVTPGNVTALGCAMHDHWFFSPDSNHLTDGTHSDGVQGHGGGPIGNVDLFGCDIQGLVDPLLPNSQANITPTFAGSNLVAGNAWYTQYQDNWTGQPIPGSAFSYPTHAFPPWGTSACLFGYGGGTPSLTNIRIRQGWLNGGGLAMVNIAPGYNNSNVTNFEITNNRIGSIGRDRQATNGRPWVVIRPNVLTTSLIVSGNVNEDDGTPNNSIRNGG